MNITEQLQTVVRATGARPVGQDRFRAPCLCDPGRNREALLIWLTPEEGWFRRCYKHGCTRAEFVARIPGLSIRGAIQRPRPRPHTQLCRPVPRASEQAIARFETLPRAVEHPYLTRKRVQACDGLRVDGDALIVPMIDERGTLRNLQSIFYQPGGLVRGGRLPGRFEKRFLEGMPTPALMFPIGKRTQRLHIAEGLATSLSVHTLTGELTLCAFMKSNLAAVGRIALRKYKPREIIFAADNDAEVA